MNALLDLTERCNLSCAYCYAGCCSQGESMSMHVLTQSADFLLLEAQKRGDKIIWITFFGGEPLVEWDLLKYAVKIFQEKAPSTLKARFAINTNGCKNFTFAFSFP